MSLCWDGGPIKLLLPLADTPYCLPFTPDVPFHGSLLCPSRLGGGAAFGLVVPCALPVAVLSTQCSHCQLPACWLLSSDPWVHAHHVHTVFRLRAGLAHNSLPLNISSMKRRRKGGARATNRDVTWDSVCFTHDIELPLNRPGCLRKAWGL